MTVMPISGDKTRRLTFSEADEGDAAMLAQLEKACIEVPWSEDGLRAAIADPLSVILVASINDEVAGYGGIRTVLDEAEIYNIAVKSQYRRQGIGAEILQTLLARAAEKGARKVFLEVSEVNAAAIALYSKHGFTELYTRKNYYPSGNARVMVKET